MSDRARGRRVARSYLYVPGDQPDKLRKAAGRGADALILDLEDAVAPGAKDAGRATVARHLDDLAGSDRPGAGGPQLWLRINPGRAGLADIAGAWRPALTGVLVAKTGSVADLTAVDLALTAAEEAAGAPAGCTAVVPLLESAAAVLAASRIATGPRVARLQIGEADLAAELGLDVAAGGAAVLQAVRTTILLASAAAGVAPPVAPVSTDFADRDALRRSTRELAAMGFVGRACIHPAQIDVVNEVFTPDPAAVREARSLVSRFDAQAAAGRGVMVADDGTMVDEAVVRRARRMIELAGGQGDAGC